MLWPYDNSDFWKCIKSEHLDRGAAYIAIHDRARRENWDGEKQPENIYGEPIDFALSVGGDGTFLTSAAAIGNKNIPILGVNCGHLGFLAEVQTNDLDAILNQLVAGQYTIEQRSLLNLSIIDKDGIQARFDEHADY